MQHIITEQYDGDNPKIKGTYECFTDAVEAVVENHNFKVEDLFPNVLNDDGSKITKEQLDNAVREELTDSIYAKIHGDYSCLTYRIESVEENEWNN